MSGGSGERAARAALVRAGIAGPFAAAIVAGTGLGEPLTAMFEGPVRRVPYADLPGLARVGVSGHAGALVAGRVAGRPVLVLSGRVHAYEGEGAERGMRPALELVRALGAGIVLLTNAAGSLRPEVGPGRIVAVSDHINLAGLNPLVGEPSDARFVPMNDAYDPALRAGLARAAEAAGVPLVEGVYAWFLGPSFETPAEIRAAGRLGADLVGMSTVPEVILARFLGLRVAALSVVTNLAAGLAGAGPSHQETKDAAARASADLARLVQAFLAELAT